MALGVGAALRLFSPGLEAELWYDEAYVVEMAERPFGEMLRLVWLGGDTNPPLYTFVLRLWLGLGGSDLHLRLLSVIFGLSSLAAIFQLGTALGGVWAGRVAAVLLAVSGWAIYYSLEVRPYALFLVLGLLSTHCLVSALADDTETERTGRRPWCLYVSWTTLAIYTHWFGLLLLPAHALGLAAERRAFSKDCRRLGLTFAAIALLCLPLLPLAVNQVRLQADVGGFSWPDRPSPASLLGLVSTLGSGRGGLLIGAFILGLALFRPDRTAAIRLSALNRPITFLLVCLAAPLGMASALSLQAEGFSFQVDRYFLPFAAHGLVLLGVCLARVDRRAATLLLAAFLVFAGRDARAWAARRPPPTWTPLRTLTCGGSSPGTPRLHLTPLTYLPARRYNDPACPGKDRLLWDPASGAGYVLDYALRGELLSARDLVAYPDELCRLGSFWLVSDPAKRGREGLLLTRLTAGPSFVPTESHVVGVVRVKGYGARCDVAAK